MLFVSSTFASLVFDGRKFLSYYKYTQDLMSRRAASCALAARYASRSSNSRPGKSWGLLHLPFTF